MACCGQANVGTETDPLVIGEANGAPAVEVVLRSPVVPGAGYGARAWVTGSLVDPYVEAAVFDLVPVEPAPEPLTVETPAPAAKRSTTTTTANGGAA